MENLNIDYLACPEKLPIDVQSIIDSFDDNAELYSESQRIVLELKVIGWYADYDLGGELYVLRPIKNN